MKWLDVVRTRLRLLLARRAAEARMDDEIRFHLDMERERLMHTHGLDDGEAHRLARVAFGGVEKHKGTLRDGRGLAWLGGASLDLRLGLRMLAKYPGLALAGGLAIAVAIGIGAGWYDLTGKILSPAIPLPDGDRIVVLETLDAATNAPEQRVARDFLEWRRALQGVDDLGAYRSDTRNLVVGRSAPALVRVAELTADALAAARVPPLLGRLLGASDELPGAPSVIVLGYDVWQRSLGGRQDVVGLTVTLGATPAIVVGVMPDGFGYPLNHDGWTPLSLAATYEPLAGPPISVIGRLAPGVAIEQANAELRGFAARTAAALPATHAHLRPALSRLGASTDFLDVAALASRNGPVLLVLGIACMSVGTLVYARTATREGEIAIRAALGAGRSRIVGQLFLEALVLASVSAAVGLLAADRVLAWGIEAVNGAGGAPFWMRRGLESTTVIYAAGLAVVSAVLLSLLPALRVTRADLQPHLTNLGTGRATLRFGRVWTAAMIAQVALTAIGIPGALESTRQTMRKVGVRARFPSHEFLAARIDLERPLVDTATADAQQLRTATIAALARRLQQEPGVLAVTFADRVPGVGGTRQATSVDAYPGAAPVDYGTLRTSTIDTDFFTTLGRPIVAGRAFDAADQQAGARAVIVNEAFARVFARQSGLASPVGARLRYRSSSAGELPSDGRPAFDVVGVVGDIGLDPDDDGVEQASVYHTASPGGMSPLLMSVRVAGAPASLAAQLPVIAATVDPRLIVQDAHSMQEWVRDTQLLALLGAQLGVTALVLFLSALGIFSLVSVGVSRRTREIGLRVALGATPRKVVGRTVAGALGLVAGGVIAGGTLLLAALAVGMGPSGRPATDIGLFAWYLAVTAVVMAVACLMACIGPTSRALRISPADALRDA